MWRQTLAWGLANLLGWCTAVAVRAEPLDLFDARPREIAVSFEVSPREAPARTRAVFSREFSAFVEAGTRDSQLRVVIPAHTVEHFLLSDDNPVHESFTDFVWTFDVETGHVLSAQLEGRVKPELDFGLLKTTIHAEIEVEMQTTGQAGFRRPRHVLGNLVFRYCSETDDPGCRLVEATPYDPRTGYVNAVGRVLVRSPVMDVRNFSPLGEARFRELDVSHDRFEAGNFAVESSTTSALDAQPIEERAGSSRPASSYGVDAVLQ